MSCILFSPLGITDPMRNGYDSAFLHIIRWYRPSHVYYFCTQTINQLCAFDEAYFRDAPDFDGQFTSERNRYEIMACRLAQRLGFPIELKKVNDWLMPEDQEIKDAHMQRAFERPFRNIIDRIRKIHPQDELIVNITSGTPAMQSVLYILQPRYEYRLMQVTNPLPGVFRDSNEVFDCKAEWERNEDNKEHEQGKRVEEIVPYNLRLAIVRDIVRKCIARYDYQSALEAAEEARGQIAPTAHKLLEAGMHRLNQDVSKADLFVAGIARLEWMPRPIAAVTSFADEDRRIYEYILYMHLKQARGELVEFARGISPLLTALLLVFAARILKKDIRTDCCEPVHKCCEVHEKVRPPKHRGCFTSYKWRRDLPDEELSGKDLSVWTIIRYMQLHYLDNPDYEACASQIEDLREFEGKLRNSVAHDLEAASYTRAFKVVEALMAHDVMQKLEALFRKTYSLSNSKDLWRPYRELNKAIEDAL